MNKYVSIFGRRMCKYSTISAVQSTNSIKVVSNVLPDCADCLMSRNKKALDHLLCLVFTLYIYSCTSRVYLVYIITVDTTQRTAVQNIQTEFWTNPLTHE